MKKPNLPRSSLVAIFVVVSFTPLEPLKTMEKKNEQENKYTV